MIALDQMYIYCHYTIALSLIALELWPKMSFSLDFRQKIRHFDLVTIATSLPISVLLLIYTHSHSGYMISAFCEPYTRLWPRRSSKTFIFGENHATPQLQRPISPKTVGARSNLTIPFPKGTDLNFRMVQSPCPYDQ